MELEARQSYQPANPPQYELEQPASRPIAPPQPGRERSLSNYSGQNSADPVRPGFGPRTSSAQSQPAPAQPSPAGSFKPFSQEKSEEMPSFELPSFSPFPRVNQANVPPSDDEKERILYNARKEVLKSPNVTVQLDWALDVLSWVELAQDAFARENKDKGARPQTPKIEHEMRIDAVSIVEYLAKQNHPQALFARSKWLEFGKFGLRQDKNEAFVGYMNASNKGWGRAAYRMGMIYENANDIKNALLLYNRGLEIGDSACSYRLGMMNLLGQHGHSKDYRAGLDLLRSAADTSDEESPQGAYVYGMLISRELPDVNIPEGMLPFDITQARQYIERSAYFGFIKAQLKMGQAYELCQLGCDFNPALSLHYYGLAAHQGQPEAALGVSRWFLFGYEGVFLKNEQLAFKYAEQAANAKLATGEFAMGYYYEIGIHVQKDLHDARLWYEKAAEHGNKDAIGRLEGLNQAKTLTKQDHETTALTRIKSMHGSMRGQRPDRFNNRAKDAISSLPTLSESTANEPVSNYPPAKSSSPNHRPVSSLSISPRQRPVSEIPDVSRPPAFAINIDQSNLALRPKSTAPYPDDERPAPLNLNRPKSTAPYPEDDARGRAPLSPHYNPSIRPSVGQQAADRPLSAFGIRPVSMNIQPQQQARPLSVSPAANNLMPVQQRPFSVNMTTRPTDNDGRGRVASAGWEPQIPPGYRQPSPGRQGNPAAGEYHDPYNNYGYQQQPQQQPPPQPQQQGPPATHRLSGGALPQADHGRNRLSKTNPNVGAPAYGGNLGVNPGTQPGRDYGTRTSSRPVSAVYPAGNNSRPDRLDSLPSQASHMRYPSGGAAGGPPPQIYNSRPQFSETGRQSAPPMQSSQPGMGYGQPAHPSQAGGLPPRMSSATQQVAPAPAPHTPKPVKQGQGPATFEEMGIPQGKNDQDCVSVSVPFLMAMALMLTSVLSASCEAVSTR